MPPRLFSVVVGAALVAAACAREQPAPPPPPPLDADWLKGRLPITAGQGTPRPGGTLTVRLATEPLGLTRVHDQQLEGTMVRFTMATVYETLGAVDRGAPGGPLLPSLATGWDESADHATLTVHLRKGVTFHDGSAFTAADVKAMVDAVRAPANPTAMMRGALEGLDRVTSPDPLTVVVHWKRPTVFGSRTFLGALPMVPAKALEGEFASLPLHRAPIGTGPFRFERWVPGASLSFTRNETYWGRKAWLERVVLRFVRDEMVATRLWEKGEFELFTRIPPAIWRGLERQSEVTRWAYTGYHRFAIPENAYGYVGWNLERPIFQDVRVRRALAMLYPADAIFRGIELELEERTTCPYWKESASCDPAVRPLPQDPAAARALLAEAGWTDSDQDGVLDRDGVPLRFTFLVAANSARQLKLVPLFQEELRKAGVELAIERVDAQVYVSRLRAHAFDAAAMSWSSPDTVQDQHQVFHSSQAKGGSNYGSYANPQVDALLEKIQTTFDPGARTALEREVHRLIFADQPYLFLSVRPGLDAVKRDVKGLAPSLAWYDLAGVWLERKDAPK